MNRICAVALTTLAAVFAVSCGKSGDSLGIVRDDKIVTLGELNRIDFEARFGTREVVDGKVRINVTHTEEGRIQVIPKGVVFTVTAVPQHNVPVLTAVPIEYTDEKGEKVTDANALHDLLDMGVYTRKSDVRFDPETGETTVHFEFLDYFVKIPIELITGKNADGNPVEVKVKKTE